MRQETDFFFDAARLRESKVSLRSQDFQIHFVQKSEIQNFNYKFKARVPRNPECIQLIYSIIFLFFFFKQNHRVSDRLECYILMSC